MSGGSVEQITGDRDVHAIGRRAVDVIEVVLDALDAQRRFERQRVAGAAAIAVGRHDDDVGDGREMPRERAQAARLIPVVIGKENPQLPFPGWSRHDPSGRVLAQRSAGGAGAIW